MKKILFVLTTTWLSVFCYAQKNPCNPEGKSYSQLAGDTTITLPSGTMITFNRCEFFDIRDCIEIIEMKTPKDLQRERINMIDEKGNIMVSYGMIRIKMDSCTKRTFEIPVRFRIFLTNNLACGEVGNPTLYIYRPGYWSSETGVQPKLVTIDGKTYMEFSTTNPVAGWNCDVAVTGRWIKFKTKSGQKIEWLRVGIGCPLFFIEKWPQKPVRKIKMRFSCMNPEGVIVETGLYNVKRDSSFTNTGTLAQLPAGGGLLNCKRKKQGFFRRMFDWAPAKRGKIQRRYEL